MPPWLVDRTLRNILIDVTGNTHRSEFSIDKLLSPDSATGRLGLTRAACLRDAAARPHEHRPATAAARAGGALPGNSPRWRKLTRWGTELHDRFLLPTFVKMDFDDVLDDLAQLRLRLRQGLVRAPHFRVPLPRRGPARDARASSSRCATRSNPGM